MSEVIVVFEIELDGTVAHHTYQKIKLLQIKILTSEQAERISKLVQQDFNFLKLPSFISDFGDIEFRYYTDLQEVRFFKKIYQLDQDGYYTNIPTLKNFKVFDDLLNYLFSLDLTIELNTLKRILSEQEYNKYYLNLISRDQKSKIIFDYRELQNLQEYFQKIYQILYLGTLDLSKSKNYDYSDITKIIESYILENGTIIEVTEKTNWIVYPDWRPRLRQIEDIQFPEISDCYQKYQTDILYYHSYPKPKKEIPYYDLNF